MIRKYDYVKRSSAPPALLACACYVARVAMRVLASEPRVSCIHTSHTWRVGSLFERELEPSQDRLDSFIRIPPHNLPMSQTHLFH